VSRIFGFSKWLLVQNLMLGINDRLPVLVLSRFFPAQVAAIYNMGFELSNLASAEFASPIRRVLFPGVASLASDEQKMIDTVVRVIGVIAIVGLPATIGIAVTAPIFVPLLLGENWFDVIPVIQVLAINGICLVLYSNSHVIFYALDKPYLTAYVTGFRLALLFPAVLLLAPRYGALGAAWALSIVNIVVTVAEYIMFFYLVAVRPKAILDAVWRSIVGATVMGVAIYWFVGWMLAKSMRMSLFLEFSISATAGVICFVTTVFLLWLISGRPVGAESYVLGRVSGLIRSRAGAAK
jgi:O-antigen/teichoic acid export membrane protein